MFRIKDKGLFVIEYLNQLSYSVSGLVIDRGPVVDHSLVIGSLFSWNNRNKSFSCLDFLYILLHHKSK